MIVAGVDIGSSSSKAERWEGSERSSSYAVNIPQPKRSEPKPPPPPPPAAQRYTAGMHVRHALWEDGLIIESRLQDGDEVVMVHFKSVGLKRLLASLAKLEITDR